MKKYLITAIIATTFTIIIGHASNIITFKQINSLTNANIVAYPRQTDEHKDNYNLPMRNDYFAVNKFIPRQGVNAKIATGTYQNFKTLQIESETAATGLLGTLTMANPSGQTVTYQVIMEQE